jgi:hypothetical protein
LYIGKKPVISKKQFVKRVYECFSKEALFDFSLLVKMDKNFDTYKSTFNKDPLCSLSLLKTNLIYIINNAKSVFLCTWAKYAINIEEVIVGLMCKQEYLSYPEASKHFEQYSNSTSKTILKHYNLNDLGLSKKISWFTSIKNIIDLKDLKQIEKTIDSIKFQLIDSIKTNKIFHMDVLLSYYLELSIIERQFSFNYAMGKKILQNILNSIIIGDLK